MDATTKAPLSATLNQVRAQQVEIGRLSTELYAVIETLKAERAGFQGAYEMQLLGSDVSDKKRENEDLLALIDFAIQSLSNTKTE